VPRSYQRYGGLFFSRKRLNQRAARVPAFFIVVIAVLLEIASPYAVGFTAVLSGAT
jgi:hypothetical protein